MTLLGTLFGFRGRIDRSTFWLCLIALGLLDAAVVMLTRSWVNLTYPGAAGIARAGGGVLAFGMGMLLVVVLSVWAGLALKVKRLHDRGRSGLWLLAVFIPIIGALWLLWEIGFAPGRRAGNRFAADEAPDDDYDDEAAPGAWMAPALGVAAAAAGTAALAAGADHSPSSQPDEAPMEPAPAAAADTAPDEPTPQETQAQIADYLVSVDHQPTLAPEPEPEPEPVSEAMAEPAPVAAPEAAPPPTAPVQEPAAVAEPAPAAAAAPEPVWAPAPSPSHPVEEVAAAEVRPAFQWPPMPWEGPPGEQPPAAADADTPSAKH